LVNSNEIIGRSN